MTLMNNSEAQKLQELKMKTTQTNKTILILQQEVSRKRDHVAFFAKLSAHITVGQRQTVIFDNSLTNVGNGYSSISGVFTAPKAGLYHFSSSMFRESSGDIDTEIMKNNLEMARNYGNTNAGSGTVNVLTSLLKDDKVYVRHMDGVSTQHIYGDNYACFSGFLID